MGAAGTQLELARDPAAFAGWSRGVRGEMGRNSAVFALDKGCPLRLALKAFVDG